jgi:hypothetical protein
VELSKPVVLFKSDEPVVLFKSDVDLALLLDAPDRERRGDLIWDALICGEASFAGDWPWKNALSRDTFGVSMEESSLSDQLEFCSDAEGGGCLQSAGGGDKFTGVTRVASTRGFDIGLEFDTT